MEGFCKLLRMSISCIHLGAGEMTIGWIHGHSLPTWDKPRSGSLPGFHLLLEPWYYNPTLRNSCLWLKPVRYNFLSISYTVDGDRGGRRREEGTWTKLRDRDPPWRYGKATVTRSWKNWRHIQPLPLPGVLATYIGDQEEATLSYWAEMTPKLPGTHVWEGWRKQMGSVFLK